MFHPKANAIKNGIPVIQIDVINGLYSAVVLLYRKNSLPVCDFI